jgi:hypothetical protein
MTPTFTRHGDHNAVGRRLTEETDRCGVPYYQEVQRLKKKHMEQQRKIALIHESIWHSVFKDMVTFGLMLFVLEMNYRYLDNNGVTAFMITTLFIVSAIMRATSYVLKRDLMNKEQAIAYIEEYYK